MRPTPILTIVSYYNLSRIKLCKGRTMNYWILIIIFSMASSAFGAINDTIDELDIETYQASMLPSILFCNALSKPTLIKPIENWIIISGNTAYIGLDNYFSGLKLMYSVNYKNINSNNSVKFNLLSGELEIIAESKDKFNLQVTAKNTCGEASTTFNIIIDEEDED